MDGRMDKWIDRGYLKNYQLFVFSPSFFSLTKIGYGIFRIYVYLCALRSLFIERERERENVIKVQNSIPRFLSPQLRSIFTYAFPITTISYLCLDRSCLSLYTILFFAFLFDRNARHAFVKIRIKFQIRICILDYLVLSYRGMF